LRFPRRQRRATDCL